MPVLAACLALSLLTTAACDTEAPTPAQTGDDGQTSDEGTSSGNESTDDDTSSDDGTSTDDDGTSDDDDGTTTDDEPEPEPLLRPATGEVIMATTNLPISWTPPPAVTQVDIGYECEGADPYEVAVGVPNSGSYEWSVPFDLVGERGCSLVVAEAGLPVQIARADELAVAAVAGVRWNGVAEDYYWLNLATGESEVVGTVGDLKWLMSRAHSAFGVTDAHVYVTGWGEFDGQGSFKLYTLAVTGELLAETVITTGPNVPWLVEVNEAGELLALSVTESSVFELVLYDPDTGVGTLAGPVGDLYGWGFETALDRAGDRLHVYGIPGDNLPAKLYTLDASSGALLGAPTVTGPGSDHSLLGWSVSSSGELIGFRWDEGTASEQMVVVDPETGEATVRGTVDGLQTWYGFAMANPSVDEIYVPGFDANDTPTLYVMNSATGELLYARELADDPSATLLVY